MRGLIAIVLVPAGIAACSSSNNPTVHAPTEHRASAETCGVSPPVAGTPPSTVDAGVTPGACSSDADCAFNGHTGHCVASSGGAKQCNYDACHTDADCGATGVCSCAGSTRGYAGSSPGNACVPSDCRVDTDCGVGGFCSPTVSADCGSFYGTVGWYCHTGHDECVVDTDCSASHAYCAFRTDVGHWVCSTGFCAG